MSLTQRYLIRRWQWLRFWSCCIRSRGTNAAQCGDLYQKNLSSSLRERDDSSSTHFHTSFASPFADFCSPCYCDLRDLQILILLPLSLGRCGWCSALVLIIALSIIIKFVFIRLQMRCVNIGATVNSGVFFPPVSDIQTENTVFIAAVAVCVSNNVDFYSNKCPSSFQGLGWRHIKGCLYRFVSVNLHYLH